MKRIRPLAEQGDAKAQTRFGDMYHFGWGVPKDNKEPLRWWRKAAKQGIAGVQSSLARLEKQLRSDGNWPPRSRQAKAKPTFIPDFEVGKDAYKQKDYATALKHFRPLA